SISEASAFVTSIRRMCPMAGMPASCSRRLQERCCAETCLPGLEVDRGQFSAGHAACPRRRGDRITLRFVALHMSANGAKRHFVATHQFDRYGGKADIGRRCCLLWSDATDPERTSAKLFHGGFSMVRKAS